MGILDTIEYFKQSDEKARKISGDKSGLNKKYNEQYGGETEGGFSIEMKQGQELKAEKPITVGRDFVSRFRIEEYTNKLYVRIIDKETRLLEFYVSKYETEDKRSKFFLNTVKKFIARPLNVDLIGIDTVEFISHNTIGSKDYREYKYKVTGFDKIVEHEGYHIFKFKATVTVDGLDILEEYKKDLSDDYKNNTARAPQSIGITPEDFYNNNDDFYDNIDNDNKKKKN
jgi:hypothetical protein